MVAVARVVVAKVVCVTEFARDVEQREDDNDEDDDGGGNVCGSEDVDDVDEHGGNACGSDDNDVDDDGGGGGGEGVRFHRPLSFVVAFES